MKKDQRILTVGIVLGIIITVVLYFVLFSAQAVTYIKDSKPVNAYTTSEKCMELEGKSCEMVVSQDNQELWIAK